MSVTEGVKLASSNHFCLYLVDLALPDGTGFELIEQIRVFDSWTPIVVCSGQKEAWVEDRVMGTGAKAFLPKPVDIDLLATTVGAILG